MVKYKVHIDDLPVVQVPGREVRYAVSGDRSLTPHFPITMNNQ
jgi:hypothetical protein